MAFGLANGCARYARCSEVLGPARRSSKRELLNFPQKSRSTFRANLGAFDVHALGETTTA
jgi:hypothetical protein